MKTWVEEKIIFTIYRWLLSYNLRFKKRYFKYKFKSLVNIHPSLNFSDFFDIKIASQDVNLLIEENISFRKYCTLYLDKNGTLTIRKNVFFNNYCSISCLGEIEIGENTLIGESVKMYDHNHKYEYNEKDLLVPRDDFNIGKIKIGKNCWIGSNVVILNNVEIGDNVIIGANCLIYKSIPSNSLVKNIGNQQIISLI